MVWQTPRAGELRERVRFERTATGANVGGYPATGWAPVGGDAAAATRWAKVEVTRGGEATVAARMQGSAGYDIWVRFDRLTSTLRASDRAVNVRTGEVYALAFIGDPDARRAWLLIQATSKGRA